MKCHSVSIYSNTTDGQFIITFVLLIKRQPFLFTHPSHCIYNYPLNVLGPVSNLQYPGCHAHISWRVLAVSPFGIWNECQGPFLSPRAGRLNSNNWCPNYRDSAASGQVNSLPRRPEKVCVCVFEKRMLTQLMSVQRRRAETSVDLSKSESESAFFCQICVHISSSLVANLH